MSLLPTQLEEWKRTSPGFINLVQQSAVAVNNIQAPNLLEFVIQVIKCFSPVNLSHPRIIANRGPYYFQKTLLETRYQNEFYRCCYDLTSGSTTSLTEFCGTTCNSSTAAADGGVDFYIPSKKWGVKILVRDGQQLELEPELEQDDDNRFFPDTRSQCCEMALDIDEYIILDFVFEAHHDTGKRNIYFISFSISLLSNIYFKKIVLLIKY